MENPLKVKAKWDKQSQTHTYAVHEKSRFKADDADVDVDVWEKQ